MPSNSTDFGAQAKALWAKVGLFTKAMLFVNLSSFIVQNLILGYLVHEDGMEYTPIALCPSAVFGQGQWFRFFTSEITHAGITHIICNMCIFTLWGVDLEKTFGTLSYLALNLWIGLISNFLTCAFQYVQVLYLPPNMFGFNVGGSDVMRNCAVGYSNILFGLMMVEAFVGGPYTKFFGVFPMRKIFVPFLFLILIQIGMPEASFLGHLTGILAALLLKYAGLSRILLPRDAWIKDFERWSNCVDSLKKNVNYLEADEGQATLESSSFFKCLKQNSHISQVSAQSRNATALGSSSSSSSESIQEMRLQRFMQNQAGAGMQAMPIVDHIKEDQSDP